MVVVVIIVVVEVVIVIKCTVVKTIVVIVAVTSSSCSSIYYTDFNTQISNFSSSPGGEGSTIQRTGAAQLSERASKASTSGEEHYYLCSYEQWKNLCCTWNCQRSPGKEK